MYVLTALGIQRGELYSYMAALMSLITLVYGQSCPHPWCIGTCRRCLFLSMVCSAIQQPIVILRLRLDLWIGLITFNAFLSKVHF